MEKYPGTLRFPDVFLRKNAPEEAGAFSQSIFLRNTPGEQPTRAEKAWIKLASLL